MIKNNSFYKSIDIDNINNIKNLLNPYGYNYESVLKDNKNTDLLKCKSDCKIKKSR